MSACSCDGSALSEAFTCSCDGLALSDGSTCSCDGLALSDDLAPQVVQKLAAHKVQLHVLAEQAAACRSLDHGQLALVSRNNKEHTGAHIALLVKAHGIHGGTKLGNLRTWNGVG